MHLLAAPKELEHQPSLNRKSVKFNIWEMDRVLTNRQFITAHLLLLIIGLSLIGVLYYFINKDSFGRIVTQYSPVTKEPHSFNLDVNSPEDDLLVFDKDILISGKTAPSSTVIITINSETHGFEVSGKGEFSKIIPLSKGANIITVNAFDSQGNTKQTVRNIFYSEEALEDEK